MNYNDLGEFIKLERKKHDFTQTDLAKLSGVTDRTIKNIEAGLKTHINTLRKVMKILGYKIEMTTQIIFNVEKD